MHTKTPWSDELRSTASSKDARKSIVADAQPVFLSKIFDRRRLDLCYTAPAAAQGQFVTILPGKQTIRFSNQN